MYNYIKWQFSTCERERLWERRAKETNKGCDREKKSVREKVYLVHLQIVVIMNELLWLLIIIIITDYTMIIIIM